MKTMTTPISTEENLDDEFYDQLLNDLTTSTTPLSSTVPLLNKTSLEHTPPSPPLDDSNSNPLDKQTNEAAVDDTKFDTFAQEFALEMEALITKLDLPTAETPCSSTLNTHPSHSFQTRVQQTMEQLKSSTSNFETNHPLDEGLEVDPDAKLEELFKNLTSHLQQGLVDESTTEAFSNDLMNSLLSKEILIEPLQMLKKHYEPFLKEKKSVVPSDQFSKFHRQYSILLEILELYQSEKEEDATKVYPLFSEMQDLGPIPDEIMTSLLASGNPNPDDPINPAELETLQSIVSDCKTM